MTVSLSRSSSALDDGWHGEPLVTVSDGCSACDAVEMSLDGATALATALTAAVAEARRAGARPQNAPHGYGEPEVPSGASGLPSLLTEAQVAEYLGVSVYTLRQLAVREELAPGTGIPARRTGRTRQFTH